MQIMVFLLENMSCNIMSFYKKRNWNLAKTKSSYPHARNERPRVSERWTDQTSYNPCQTFQWYSSPFPRPLAKAIHSLTPIRPYQIHPKPFIYWHFVYSEDLLAGPRAPFGTPVWNPFLNLLGTSFMWRIRPVPVVFLLLAFSPQLSVQKYLY